MNSNLQEAKERLRREMKARRKAIPADERAAADAVVCERLKARRDLGETAGAPDGDSPLAVYLAGATETNIDAFIEHMLGAGVKLVAPRWNGRTYELARLAGLDGESLRSGPMGIREPAGEDVVAPGEVRAWIVPGLAFTRDGRRLGHGGGWYDRLLAAAPHGAVKIGAAYSFQIVDDLPSEPHDARLAGVVDDAPASRPSCRSFHE